MLFIELQDNKVFPKIKYQVKGKGIREDRHISYVVSYVWSLADMNESGLSLILMTLLIKHEQYFRLHV